MSTGKVPICNPPPPQQTPPPSEPQNPTKELMYFDTYFRR